jgi:cell division septation protein DedD
VGELAHALPDSSRQPVSFDHESNRLTIGDRSTVVPDSAAGNEAMLRSYLALVAEVRGTPIGSGIEVRHDDVVVLAEILDLSDADLEVHLANLLGVSANVAADVHRRIRRHLAFAAAFTAALSSIAMISTVNVSTASPVAATPAVVSSTHEDVPATTAIVAYTAPVADTAPVAEEAAPPPPPPPAPHSQPTSADAVQIGDAMVIERGQPPEDSNTEIGDSVTYER